MAEMSTATFPADLSDKLAASHFSLSNFPLPRELRDEIYEYLLLAKHTRAKPWHTRPQDKKGSASVANKRYLSAAHTYEFHPAILAVNKEISIEAKEVLLKNHFVVVSYDSSVLSELKHIVDLPIVTENKRHVALFKHHSLRIHLESPKRSNESDIKLPPDSVLMLAEDLPKLAVIVQMPLLLETAPRTLYIRVDGQPEDEVMALKRESGMRLKTKLRLHDKVGASLKPSDERMLLAPFEKLVLSQQKVVVRGYSEPLGAYVTKLKETMTQQGAYLSAIYWRLFEIFQELQQGFELLIAAGELKVALGKLTTIQGPMFSDILKIKMLVPDSTAGVPANLLARGILDVSITAVYLYLRLGQVSDAIDTMPFLRHFLEFLIETPGPQYPFERDADGQTPTTYSANLWIHHVLSLLETVAKGDSLARLIASSEELGNEHPFIARYVAHDMQLARSLDLKGSDFKKGLGTMELLKQMSVCQLAPMIVKTPIPKDCLGPPTFDGLLDTEHLKKVTKTIVQELR